MITKKLEKIANTLDQKNLVKEASQVDRLLSVYKKAQSDVMTVLNSAVSYQQPVRIYYTRKADGQSGYYDVSPFEVKGDKFWAQHEGKTHSFVLGNIGTAQLMGAMPVQQQVQQQVPEQVQQVQPLQQVQIQPEQQVEQERTIAT